MGWFFRKRLKLLPGVTLNLGNGGISSVRFGGRGGGITVGKSGTYASASIPGTGLGYRARLDQPGPSAADIRETERAIADQGEAEEATVAALNKVADSLLNADQQKHEVVKLTPRELEFLRDMSVADYLPSPAQAAWIQRIAKAVQQRLASSRVESLALAAEPLGGTCGSVTYPPDQRGDVIAAPKQTSALTVVVWVVAVVVVVILVLGWFAYDPNRTPAPMARTNQPNTTDLRVTAWYRLDTECRASNGGSDVANAVSDACWQVNGAHRLAADLRADGWCFGKTSDGPNVGRWQPPGAPCFSVVPD